MGYSFRLAARVLLYASSHRQDDTYHSLCYTNRGALVGNRSGMLSPEHYSHTYWVNQKTLHGLCCCLWRSYTLKTNQWLCILGMTHPSIVVHNKNYLFLKYSFQNPNIFWRCIFNAVQYRYVSLETTSRCFIITFAIINTEQHICMIIKIRFAIDNEVDRQ